MDCQLLLTAVASVIHTKGCSGPLARWKEAVTNPPVLTYGRTCPSLCLSWFPAGLSPGPNDLESGQVTFRHSRLPSPVA